jgi:hypothetical protein
LAFVAENEAQVNEATRSATTTARTKETRAGMNRLLWRIAPAILSAALASCGGGGGGAVAGSPAAQSSLPTGAPTAVQASNAKLESDQGITVQGLVARQADQGRGFAPLQGQGADGLALFENRAAENYIQPMNRRLFAYLPALNKIGSFPNTNPASGQKVVFDLIAPYVIGPYENRYPVTATNAAYDAKRDRLYIPTSRGAVGLVQNASAVTGDFLLPLFYVPTPMDVLGFVVLDAKNDVLWLIGSANSEPHYISIAKIKNISALEKSNVALNYGPGAKLLNAENTTVWHARSSTFTAGFAIDAERSMVYMENGDVFDLNAIAPTPAVDTAPGSAFHHYPLDEIRAWSTVPVRRFFDTPRALKSVALDPIRDRLYFVDAFNRKLLVVENASFATGSATPIVIDLPQKFATLSTLAIDAKNDRIYIGGVENDIYIINDASAIQAGSTLPSAYTFTAPSPTLARSEVWGIAVPQ